jgi:DNA-binding transcriptional LysR family regulator
MSIPSKDLNLLIALRALLEEANVTRAGERVNMSQSSMSSALARLRTQFGDELLVRVGRDYELTPLGQLLLPQLQRTLPLIQKALLSESDFDASKSQRSYRLMMSDYAATELSPVFARALEVAPSIKFEILPLPSNPTDSDRDLWTNDFILSVPGVGVNGDKKELFKDHYVCVIDRDNPALVAGQLSWEAFIELPQVVCDFGRAHLTPAARRLSELGFQRKPHVKTTSFLPIPKIVSGTDQVGVIPARIARRMPNDITAIAVEAPFGHVEIRQTLWWHDSHNTDPSHVWMRNFLIENASLVN